MFLVDRLPGVFSALFVLFSVPIFFSVFRRLLFVCLFDDERNRRIDVWTVRCVGLTY